MNVDWNTTATIASAIATVIYAILTTFIVRANRGVVREMKRQFDESMRPYVRLTTKVDPIRKQLFVHIHNSGKTPAFTIRFSFSAQVFTGDSGSPVHWFPAFKQGIDYLPPGASLRFPVGEYDTTTQRFTTRPARFEILTSYDDSAGRTYGEERTVIDIAIYEGMPLPYVGPLAEYVRDE